MRRKWLSMGLYAALIAGAAVPLLLRSSGASLQAEGHFYPADSGAIRYMGRVDFSNPLLPRFWAPGTTVKFAFKGTSCYAVIDDQVKYGNNHQWIEVQIDNSKPQRIHLTEARNNICLGRGLPDTVHEASICKDTEASIGWLQLEGVRCQKLLRGPALPKRKIEFFGDSITCGFGDDTSPIACGKGQWYDQHNAWLSYGPIVARHLHAQWHVTAYSGIGLIHSCCSMQYTLPEIWDTYQIRPGGTPWNTRLYQPDVVTICLGQNDGIQPEEAFVGAYVRFIHTLRQNYPNAQIVCLTSPMGDTHLNPVLQKYLAEVVKRCHAAGDSKVHKFYFSQQFGGGCGGHPDLAGQRTMANEVTAYLGRLMHWQ